eukprot:664284-Rhodomonas_salina.3
MAREGARTPVSPLGLFSFPRARCRPDIGAIGQTGQSILGESRGVGATDDRTLHPPTLDERALLIDHSVSSEQDDEASLCGPLAYPIRAKGPPVLTRPSRSGPASAISDISCCKTGEIAHEASNSNEDIIDACDDARSVALDADSGGIVHFKLRHPPKDASPQSRPVSTYACIGIYSAFIPGLGAG